MRGRAHPTQLYRPLATQNSEDSPIIIGRQTGFRLYVDKTHIDDTETVVALLERALKLVKGE